MILDFEVEMEENERIGEETIAALRTLIETVVTLIVDHPEDVEVIIPDNGGYNLVAQLHTHPRDVGQVIGRSGSVAQSIRCLIFALQGKHNIRMDLDYVTDQDNRRKRRVN